MSDRERGLPETLRRRLAHYGNRGCLRSRRGFGPFARIIRTTDALGYRIGGHAARWSPGDVRLHDQELSSRTRRTEWLDGRDPRVERLHKLGTKSRGEIRLGQ